jgi:hypothetical protein
VNEEKPDPELSDPEWFREPSSREHKIAAGLFGGFGIFFILLFLAERGWGFRWVILGLAVISIWKALWHWTGAAKRQP